MDQYLLSRIGGHLRGEDDEANSDAKGKDGLPVYHDYKVHRATSFLEQSSLESSAPGL